MPSMFAKVLRKEKQTEHNKKILTTKIYLCIIKTSVTLDMKINLVKVLMIYKGSNSV